jgi:predicted alpha/beta hydrolase family esterase
MSVDPRKSREILVVHGIQTGTDGDLNSHRQLGNLVARHLNGIPIGFDCELYRYENVNDHAQAKLTRLMNAAAEALLGGRPLAGMLLDGIDDAIDLVYDVVIALAADSTAAAIRDGLCERIMDSYLNRGHPLYLVAHSLGSVYALDAVNQLIRTRPSGVFDRDRRKTWPVQGLITLGSPLGLPMFGADRKLEALGPGRKWFRWFNYWSRTDPVVSASFYGAPNGGYQIAERFGRPFALGGELGWIVHDRVVDSGAAWLAAHAAYWSYPALGDDLVTFISS